MGEVGEMLPPWLVFAAPSLMAFTVALSEYVIGRYQQIPLTKG
jgi:hypothetical protein